MENNNLAEEIHEACHEACLECPQFVSYDDDSLVETEQGGEIRKVRFDAIPKKGAAFTIRFWLSENTLWDSGYEEYLPQHISEIFDNVDTIMDRALTTYLNNLGKKQNGNPLTEREQKLRGQLTNCVNHLELVKRSTSHDVEDRISECIESANTVLYEIMGEFITEAEIDIIQRDIEIRILRDAVQKALQLANIARDWNLEEVEIDDEMVDIYDLIDEFEDVLDTYDNSIGEKV